MVDLVSAGDWTVQVQGEGTLAEVGRLSGAFNELVVKLRGGNKWRCR